MKFAGIVATVAIGVAAILTPVLAMAADMVITSEIAATHWKARQMDELAADITKRTNGRINAKVFHASTLYKDKDALAALSTGAVHMVWSGQQLAGERQSGLRHHRPAVRRQGLNDAE